MARSTGEVMSEQFVAYVPGSRRTGTFGLGSIPVVSSEGARRRCGRRPMDAMASDKTAKSERLLG